MDLTLPITRISLKNPILRYNGVPAFSIPWYGKLFTFSVSNGELLSCKGFTWIDKSYNYTIDVADIGFSRVRNGQFEPFRLGLTGITMPSGPQIGVWSFNSYSGKMFVRFGPSGSLGMLECTRSGTMHCYWGKWVKSNYDNSARSSYVNSNSHNSGSEPVSLTDEEFAYWKHNFVQRVNNDNERWRRYDIMVD